MFEGVKFDWDAGNTRKCRKHGLSVEDIEAVFANNPDVVLDSRHSEFEERLIAIGMTQNGRMVFVGFTLRLRGPLRLIRPITARYMHKKEILRYGKASS